LGKLADGIYIDLGMSKPALVAAVTRVSIGLVFRRPELSGAAESLYDVGPAAPQQSLRLADDVRVFDANRLSLYKAPKMSLSYAEYYFQQYQEEVTLPDGTVIPERPVASISTNSSPTCGTRASTSASTWRP
jgi:hypothetical protein